MYAYVNQFTCKRRKSNSKSKKKITLLLNFIIFTEGIVKIKNILYVTYAYNNIILIYNDLYQRRNIVFEMQGVRELWSMI